MADLRSGFEDFKVSTLIPI